MQKLIHLTDSLARKNSGNIVKWRVLLPSKEQMAKILIVEDDNELSGALEDWLTGDGHLVEVVGTGNEAIDKLHFYKFDLVILDLKLPDLHGVEVLKQFRTGGGRIPILILTGKKDMDDKESSFFAGADDYLTKPFDPRELSYRVMALLRRASTLCQTIVQIGDIIVDPQSVRVTKAGKEIRLQPKEFALLEFLMRHPNQVFSHQALLDRVWASESDACSDSLRVYITKLRNKLDTDGQPSLITTVHRLGYMLKLSNGDAAMLQSIQK